METYKIENFNPKKVLKDLVDLLLLIPEVDPACPKNSEQVTENKAGQMVRFLDVKEHQCLVLIK